MEIYFSNEKILFHHGQLARLNTSRSEYDAAMKLVEPDQYKSWELGDCSLQAQLDNVSHPSISYNCIFNQLYSISFSLLRALDWRSSYSRRRS